MKKSEKIQIEAILRMVVEQNYYILTLEQGIKEDWCTKYSPDIGGKNILWVSAINKLRKTLELCEDEGYCVVNRKGKPYFYDFTDYIIKTKKV